MSIYKTTIWELAKKYGSPTGEFMEKLESFGFSFKSHLARLTQPDLDAIMAKMYPTSGTPTAASYIPEEEVFVLKNPGVVIAKKETKYVTLLLDSDTDEHGDMKVSIVKEYLVDSRMEALVKFDQLRLRYNMDSTFDN